MQIILYMELYVSTDFFYVSSCYLREYLFRFNSFGLYIVLFYMQACCIEYIILESDNLSSLFPNAHLSLGGFELNAHILFALLTTLAILPTVWLRDLRILSYISGKEKCFLWL